MATIVLIVVFLGVIQAFVVDSKLMFIRNILHHFNIVLTF